MVGSSSTLSPQIDTTLRSVIVISPTRSGKYEFFGSIFPLDNYQMLIIHIIVITEDIVKPIFVLLTLGRKKKYIFFSNQGGMTFFIDVFLLIQKYIKEAWLFLMTSSCSSNICTFRYVIYAVMSSFSISSQIELLPYFLRPVIIERIDHNQQMSFAKSCWHRQKFSRSWKIQS